jgi:hypothetical protein
MGTLVGSAILNQISKIDPAIGDLLLIENSKSSAPENIWILLGFGLVYCYVSSIPILVFHASRFPFSTSGFPSKKAKGFFLIISAFIIPAALLTAFSIFLVTPEKDAIAAEIAVLAALGILSLQYFFCFRVIVFHNEAFEYYKKLARARHISGNRGEIVTSYRHLREHGNSIFIVVLELLLGVLLIASYYITSNVVDPHISFPPQIYIYGFVIFLWILPGSFIWWCATLLERNFVREFG